MPLSGCVLLVVKASSLLMGFLGFNLLKSLKKLVFTALLFDVLL